MAWADARADSRPAPRVMWLLNHGTLRSFEMQQLQSLGVREIFLPKSFPYHEGNLSASIETAYDSTLSLSEEELGVLNAQDWYGDPSPAAWDIANRHFDVLFFAFFPDQIDSVTRHFRGDVVLRVFGHARGYTYSGLLYQHLGVPGVERIQRLGHRFWFGEAYAHLHDIEDEFVRRRACYLPLGLRNADVDDRWRGDDARLYFVCPRIGSSTHFRSVYEQFTRDFKGVPYVVAGAQPVAVNDAAVIGYVPAEAHRDNMQRFRVMYYHSTEPNHVHYHPFEAIRAGMPVVYMAGGMLDRLAGTRLPGCCNSVSEARRKVERLLGGDTGLADRIRRTQPRMLDPMRPERCEPIWRENFGRLLAERAARSRFPAAMRPPARRVAIVVPSVARPAELVYASRAANILLEGARAAGDEAHIVIAAASDASDDLRKQLGALPPATSVRAFRWKRLDRGTAEIALEFSGHTVKLPASDYIVPDDGINNLLDCDVWVVVSDELSLPLFPLRPYCMALFGYPQRHMPLLEPTADLPYRLAAQRAALVWASTGSVASDAAQYAGVTPSRIRVLPSPPPVGGRSDATRTRRPRSIGIVVDGVPGPCQLSAIKTVQTYYVRFRGSLPCTAIGRGPAFLGRDGYALPVEVVGALESDRRLRARIAWEPCGGEARSEIIASLSALVFTGHADGPAAYVLDALRSGVHVVAVDSSPMRELKALYDELVELVPNDPDVLARRLRAFDEPGGGGPTPSALHNVDELTYRRLAVQYWQAIREVT